MNTCWVRYTKALDMEKALTPNRLDVDPSSPNTAKEFNHWLKTFNYFLAVLPKEGLDELSVLTNFVSPHVYDYIIDCETYAEAIRVLKSVFGKTQNEIYARHLLVSRKQNPGETVEEYMQALKNLAKDCSFKPVDAATYCNETVRDIFIAGLQSNFVRQKLLDNKTLDAVSALEQAKIFDPIDESGVSSSSISSDINTEPEEEEEEADETKVFTTTSTDMPGQGPSIHSHIHNSNGPDNSVKKNRRKNGNIRNHQPYKTIDTKNIIPSTMNTRRRNGFIRETRLRSDPRNMSRSKLMTSKPSVMRPVHTSKKSTNQQDWRKRLTIKQNAIDLLKRRSHRMRKPPERLDW